jgi:hypothetical protein
VLQGLTIAPGSPARGRRCTSRTRTEPSGCPAGAGEDHGIDHDKNWLRFPYDSTVVRSHYLHPHPHVISARVTHGRPAGCGVGRAEFAALDAELSHGVFPCSGLLALLAAGAHASARAVTQSVRRFCACIGSPCLRRCVHGASIGGSADLGARPLSPDSRRPAALHERLSLWRRGVAQLRAHPVLLGRGIPPADRLRAIDGRGDQRGQSVLTCRSAGTARRDAQASRLCACQPNAAVAVVAQCGHLVCTPAPARRTA